MSEEKEKCHVEGCNREVMYKSQQVCQMHYFRFMRTGSYEKRESIRKPRIIQSGGYAKLYLPEHPLASKSGYVYEHRKLMYDKYGDDLPDCEICGAFCDWKPYHTHIDHIDKNKLNNTEQNLRVLCNACNTRRDFPPAHERKNCMAITLDGVTMTPHEWSRVEGVTVNSRTISRRIKAGMDAKEAIFKPSKTYKGVKHGG